MIAHTATNSVTPFAPQTARPVFFRSLRCLHESARLSGSAAVLLMEASDADESAVARFQQLIVEGLCRRQLSEPLLNDRELATFAGAMDRLA